MFYDVSKVVSSDGVQLSGQCSVSQSVSNIYDFSVTVQLSVWTSLNVCVNTEGSLYMNIKLIWRDSHECVSFYLALSSVNNNAMNWTLFHFFIYYKYTKNIKTDTLTWLVTTHQNAVKTFNNPL